MKNIFKNPWAKGGEYYPEEVLDATKVLSPIIENSTSAKIKWVEYDGQNIRLYDGVFNNKAGSTLIKSYKATSGLLGHQVASEQDNSDSGPVPEGEYKIDLSLDFLRKAGTLSMSTCEIASGKGIQILPWNINRGGTCAFPGWGQWRARIEKVKVSSSRDNFYLHDSYKGYSHGCIETDTELYYDLYNIRKKGVLSIKLKVSYSSLTQSTDGGTRQFPPPWGKKLIKSSSGDYYEPDINNFPDKSKL